MKNKAIVFILILILILTTVTQSLANNDKTYEIDYDFAPIIGDFKYDAEYHEIIKKKEENVNQYYKAKMSGDLEAMEFYLGELSNMDSRNTRDIDLQGFGRRLAIYQFPQETNYWCGYAAMQSLLDYENINMTQGEIADIVYSRDISCPWYLSHGNSKEQFPVAVELTRLTGYNYIPYPYGAAGTTTLTEESVKSRVIGTIDRYRGLMGCGTSRGSRSGHASILPGYPNRDITHWLAIDGYNDDGEYIYIIDPAKSNKVSWSDAIDAYYKIPVEKFTAFLQTRGLIW